MNAKFLLALLACAPLLAVSGRNERSSLAMNERLKPGEELVDPGHRYHLALDPEGVLYVYEQDPAHPQSGPNKIWQSATSPFPPDDHFAVLQDNGDLCVYHQAVPARQLVWHSDREIHPQTWRSFSLELQEDGNLCIYVSDHGVRENGPFWHTGPDQGFHAWSAPAHPQAQAPMAHPDHP